jgi:DNA-binding NarL/FixJ family response regulator
VSSSTILIADDHPVVRDGLRMVLERERDLRVIGEASDGVEAVREIERSKPDVLLLGLMMPALYGLDVVREAKRLSPATRVVVLSMYSAQGYVATALRQGAEGFLAKGATGAEVVKAVREVLAGRRYLSPPLGPAGAVIVAEEPTAAAARYEQLTTREREIVHLAAEGLTNREMGTRLHVSPRTVETHRANAMRKLHLRNQSELVRFALEKGLLEPDDLIERRGGGGPRSNA